MCCQMVFQFGKCHGHARNSEKRKCPRANHERKVHESKQVEWQQLDNTTCYRWNRGVIYICITSLQMNIWKASWESVQPATCVLNRMSDSDKKTGFKWREWMQLEMLKMFDMTCEMFLQQSFHANKIKKLVVSWNLNAAASNALFFTSWRDSDQWFIAHTCCQRLKQAAWRHMAILGSSWVSKTQSSRGSLAPQAARKCRSSQTGWWESFETIIICWIFVIRATMSSSVSPMSSCCETEDDADEEELELESDESPSLEPAWGAGIPSKMGSGIAVLNGRKSHV